MPDIFYFFFHSKSKLMDKIEKSILKYLECHLLEASEPTAVKTYMLYSQEKESKQPKHLTHCIYNRTKCTLQVYTAIHHQNLHKNVNRQEAQSCSKIRESQRKSNSIQSLAPQDLWFKSNSIWYNESCYHMMVT